MNGESLAMVFEEVEQLVKKLHALESEFNENCQNIKNLNKQLQQSWRGKDSNSYMNAVEGQANVMDTVGKTIGEIAEYMRRVKNGYMAAQDANTLR